MDSQSNFRGPSAWDCVGAFIIVVFGVVISAWNIFSHLTHYESPTLQRNIVRILVIAPLYGIFSWLSLVLPSHFVIFDAVRDIWEAVVIYCFLALIMDYAGGELACAETIQRDPGTLQHVFPLTIAAELGWLDREIPLNPHFLKWCRRATLQFVVIKPTMAFLTVWIYTSLSAQIWAVWSVVEIMIYNIAYSVALYALVLFYLAIKNTATIQGVRPLPKFIAVKVIVFATYWQSILILAVCPNMPGALVKRWNSFVLCIECPLTALLQAWAFPGSEFMSPPPPPPPPMEVDLESAEGDETPVMPPPNIGFIVPNHITRPLGRTWKELKNKKNRRTALENAKDAFGVGDVMEDAVFTFKSRYARHARLASNYEQAMTGSSEKSENVSLETGNRD
eukprot:Gregarina_sp_Poly_1__8237@NODE_479_length_8056_cov_202_332958_g385_i1_p3_GENE_NODE_479_length_8056_cov_202_332958_g385_i1NODE_479_length_8056_cov_202_332958_g385_i1_p3_ORF_typecomplete_len393_score47_14Solute_trans_a/PF03619_16/2_7e66_NODE_479_length_8056_cov_202_332958_g385_i130514229